MVFHPTLILTRLESDAARALWSGVGTVGLKPSLCGPEPAFGLTGGARGGGWYLGEVGGTGLYRGLNHPERGLERARKGT